ILSGGRPRRLRPCRRVGPMRATSRANRARSDPQRPPNSLCSRWFGMERGSARDLELLPAPSVGRLWSTAALRFSIRAGDGRDGGEGGDGGRGETVFHLVPWRATMAERIASIEGTGPFVNKLTAAKIATTSDLLEVCSTPAGRKNLAAQTGIAEHMLLDWANLADLMRLKGVGGQHAELLHAAGVDSIRDLRLRTADALSTRMKQINEQKKLVKSVVSPDQVQTWIDDAKRLEPKLVY